MCVARGCFPLTLDVGIADIRHLPPHPPAEGLFPYLTHLDQSLASRTTPGHLRSIHSFLHQI